MKPITFQYGDRKYRVHGNGRIESGHRHRGAAWYPYNHEPFSVKAAAAELQHLESMARRCEGAALEDAEHYAEDARTVAGALESLRRAGRVDG